MKVKQEKVWNVSGAQGGLKVSPPGWGFCCLVLTWVQFRSDSGMIEYV